MIYIIAYIFDTAISHLSQLVQLCISVDPTKADLGERLSTGGPAA